MKKRIALLLSLVMIAAVASVPAAAKILHQCHGCGGDGVYTCDAVDCKNGKLTCGRCTPTGCTRTVICFISQRTASG